MRFVYRHFIVIGQESIIAAMGTECAAEQDMFWEYHDAIFDNWDDARQNRFGLAWLQSTAESLELDLPAFMECLDSGRHYERIRSSQIDGMGRGIRGTPTVFVNGKRVDGPDYEVYHAAIEAALEESN